MRKNDLIKVDNCIYRILEVSGDSIFVIDCKKLNMPKWVAIPKQYFELSEEELSRLVDIHFDLELSAEQEKIAHRRFTAIADAIACVGDKSERNKAIEHSSKMFSISKQS